MFLTRPSMPKACLQGKAVVGFHIQNHSLQCRHSLEFRSHEKVLIIKEFLEATKKMEEIEPFLGGEKSLLPQI